jgi:hypothetical protein
LRGTTTREAAAWLQGEVDAGRLAPTLDAEQLAHVASVLANGVPKVVRRRQEKKEVAGDGRSATSTRA